MAVTKSEIDWAAIEPEWRAGVKSKKQLSEEFNVSRAAMDKRFSKAGIERDLLPQIQAKADALVTQDAVTRLVTPATKLIEREIVEANAEMQARIRREQRRDITKLRNLANLMVAELEIQTKDHELFLQLEELLIEDGTSGHDKRNQLFGKVLSSSSRINSIKILADTIKTLFALEREAFGIDSRLTGDESDDKEITIKLVKASG